MKVLFIGGTGIISSACSNLALEKGIELYHLNRGTSLRKVDGVKQIQGDIRDKKASEQILKNYSFDVVVNWITFLPEQIETDIQLFKDKTQQYVFISSASAYQKPPARLPVTEETPLENPYWQYSRDKIACEKKLMEAYHKLGFPATIVRPSHTYDKTLLPFHWGYTVVDRIKRGKKVVVHGDGTSIWVMTHHKDFATGFIGLLGNPKAIGQAFHITSDELMTWNAIHQWVAQALGTTAQIVHVTSDKIALLDPDMGAGLLGDKAHSMIFDNSKIKHWVPDFKAQIPFREGIKEVIQWYENNPAFQIVNPQTDAIIDRIIQQFG